MSKIPILIRRAAAATASMLLTSAAAGAAGLKFDFTPGPAHSGFVKVGADSTYGSGKSYGFVSQPAGRPAIFAVTADEGNYQITVRFGDPKRATSTTVKAESRRLMTGRVETAPGKTETRTFVVNVRKPEISTGGVTNLNKRELGPPVSPDWDDRLTLEFDGSVPGVMTMEIEPVETMTTVFIAGDSTVTDQVNEPYTGWGQMIPRFFGSRAAVSNQAESGLALSSFESQKRLAKVLSMMKQGDYMLIQFGHNDQKDKREGAGPFTTYKRKLIEYANAVRGKGGNPVLVTPMERRRFDKNGKQERTLADYAEAVRQAGREENVPVIDLNEMSLKFYAALGPEGSKKAFVFYPAGAFPKSGELKDNTHHNNYGAYELARCVVEGIKAEVPALAKLLANDVGEFDPSKPDSPGGLAIPASMPSAAITVPAGS